MVSTITARFCCRSPLTDLLKFFTVLCTLLFQYLYELIEGVVRDFASPKAFHTVKVQGFKTEYIKLRAKFGGKFPLPIFSLAGDFSVVPCQSTDTTPPIIRTFDFTTQCFAQGSQRFQDCLKNCGDSILLPSSLVRNVLFP